MSAGRIVLIVLGSLAALVAVGLLAVGGFLMWANETQRDDGFFKTPTERFDTDSYALTSEGFRIAGGVPRRLLEEELATLRIRATDAEEEPIFVGVGRESDVRAYLQGVAYDEVTDVDFGPFRPTYRRSEGTQAPGPPGQEGFWVASAEGPGTQSAEWDVERGRWVIVVMNADASPGVAADVDLGANVPWVFWLALGLLIAGALLLALGALMIALGARSPGAPPPGAELDEVPPAPVEEPLVEEPYIVSLEGARDADLNRWLPLVKWLLLIPHVLVLVFLWIAFFALTVIAGFAILFTERYPRSIFDFNVGVLRWTWRVLFYGYGALGTDRYPPFTLGRADYPAVLVVPYPERLSRKLVLVKWWLLAIPHYIVVGALAGGAGWWWWWGAGGLVGALALVAAGGLVLFNRYPRGVFDLLVGANRWVFRVAAYAGLMRDEYPPFRLGR
jgi:hypothetical protein